MKITAKSWSNYIGKLAKVNQKAGSLMRKYVETNGVENTKALMDYAMALVQRYGEGSAELACQMYDAMAELSGVSLPAAEPAEVVKYKEVAKMVNATKNSVDQIERGVERLVKKAGADTTLKNAERDNAEFAWIPHGDTCAYCLAIAAQGWRHVSLNTVGNGYGEHIHANCDCEYAVRFNKKTTVQGYDPDKYSEMFKNTEGNTEKDKINALRREKYAENKLTQSKEVDTIDYSKAIFIGQHDIEWHFDKHKDEFQGWTKEEYLTRAREILVQPLEEGEVEEIRRSDGSISRYCYSKNEFVATTDDGNIRTFFKPKYREEYWKDERTRN